MKRPSAEILPVCDYCHESIQPGDDYYEFPIFGAVVCAECIWQALKPYRRTEGDIIDRL